LLLLLLLLLLLFFARHEEKWESGSNLHIGRISPLISNLGTTLR